MIIQSFNTETSLHMKQILHDSINTIILDPTDLFVLFIFLNLK